MKLMILDGNSIINRAFYGVHILTTKDGLCTNAVYGFLNILEKLRAEEQPDALCVAFDLKAPTFRHLKYDGYKATRHPMPDELAMQMPVMKDVLRAMNIPIYECEGWEADDVIGTVGKRCEKSGWDCVIVTGDRDSLQLVSEHVFVRLISSKGGQTCETVYSPQSFEAEYGFAPIRLIDLKSLMGDSSDNIPGVAGVGPKTATQLLLDYGTLDGIYENLNGIKDSLRKKLEQNRELAYLSYDLATIRCEAPIEFAPENNMISDCNEGELYDLFTKLEFSKLIARYHLHPKQEKPEVQGECFGEIVESAERAQSLLSEFEAAPYVCAVFEEDLSGFAVQPKDADGAYYFGEKKLGSAFSAVLNLFLSKKIGKTVSDAKSLMRKLLEKSLPIEGFTFDTALAGYVLDATQSDFSIERLFMSYCGSQLGLADAETVGAEAAHHCELFAKAAALDALHDELSRRLFEIGSEKLYFEIELPLCRVLAEMENVGVQVDRFALISFGNMLEGRITDTQNAIYGYAGEEFNINSTKALGAVLFEKLGLPPLKKTKSGYSTNADVLEKLKNRHPIIERILEYRTLTKLKSTYAEGLLKQIAEDDRIHTTFQNMVTATGRLSSTEPNLQNIPVRTELGSEIRKMFVPQDGCVFVDADYSQIELRVLAHIADDAKMQDAFRSGSDIHTATAASVFRVEPNAVTPLMRRSAKAVNFGIVYGISEFSLADDIGVSRREAKEYIDTYLENFSGVRTYMHDIVEKAKHDGYVTTLFGRRRLLPELKSSNFNIRSFGERVALNTPIQGTAADLIKIAMLRVADALKKANLKARLLLQVHDELIVECPEKEKQTVLKIMTEQMQSVVQLSVPLIAEAKLGTSWYEAK